MLKKILIILISTSILLFSLSFIKISNPKKSNNKKDLSIPKTFINIKEEFNKVIEENNIKENKDIDNEIIGKLIINKLNINKNLYKINSKNNNIEKNITILNNSIPPTEDNSIMFIAAHSGTSSIAFFKDLDKLEEDDEVILIYNNKEYKYIVKNCWEEEKNGYINVQKLQEKQLILTTCSPSKENLQLIVNCILKSE